MGQTGEANMQRQEAGRSRGKQAGVELGRFRQSVCRKGQTCATEAVVRR
jgi:hypothetical protein